MTETSTPDQIVFANEDMLLTPAIKRIPWKLLIVDDEEEVHSITRMVLSGFEFEGTPLTFLNAFSAAEAKVLFSAHPDIAVVLLDVVMETPQAGLELANYVRSQLDNALVRIILRTGQPGQAPERHVITEYDVNDYKNKSELTAQKLYTSVTTALRSYRDLRAIHRSRQGLEHIIHASADLFRTGKLESFARGVLMQMTSLLRLDDSSLYLERASGFAAHEEHDDFIIVAGTGEFAGLESQRASTVLPPREMELIRDAVRDNACMFVGNYYLGSFGTQQGLNSVLFLRVSSEISDFEQNIIQIFAANISAAVENLLLNKEIADTHREVIFTLSEVVESRTIINEVHVHRVAKMAQLLGHKAGLPEEDCELLLMALPMHDIGKVAIPDDILLKRGLLDDVESSVMRQHPQLGYDILSRSDQPILHVAARIALEHQEAWDGSGYPRGLHGEEIHIHSRIARVVDVLDSLLSTRVYKPAWSVTKALAYMKDQSAKLFDPSLVRLVLDNADEFLVLRQRIIAQNKRSQNEGFS